jgi:NDP-sugar pyrophosphorylase family protein
VISNDIIATLAKNKYLDMPTLFEQKQEEGRNVLKFPIHEYWLDIGRHDDFQKAQLDIYDLELI